MYSGLPLIQPPFTEHKITVSHQTEPTKNGHLTVQNQVCADILSVHISLHIVYKQADVHASYCHDWSNWLLVWHLTNHGVILCSNVLIRGVASFQAQEALIGAFWSVLNTGVASFQGSRLEGVSLGTPIILIPSHVILQLTSTDEMLYFSFFPLE